MDDSVITCDETIDMEETTFNEKKNKLVKHKIFIFYLPFY